MQRVGFLYRAAAYFIDVVLSSLVSVIGILLLQFLILGVDAPHLSTSNGKFNIPIFMYSLVWAIFALPEIMIGASPGKLILGLRIRYDTGERASPEFLLRRYCCKHFALVVDLSGLVLMTIFGCPFGLLIGILVILGNLVGLIFSLGYLLALTQDKQALHDKLIGTAVYFQSDLEQQQIDVQEIAPPVESKARADPNDLFKKRW